MNSVYVKPSISVYEISTSFVAQSVANVTFGTTIDSQWDGIRHEEELIKEDKDWHEW